jgi:hypothetical protein
LNSDLFIATDINSGKIVYGEIFEYSYPIAPEHEPVRFLPPPSPGSPALLTIHVGGGQGTGLQHTQIKVYLIRDGIVKQGYEGDVQWSDFGTCTYSSEDEYSHSFTPTQNKQWRMHITGKSIHQSCPDGLSCEECTKADIREDISMRDETHLLEMWPLHSGK